MRIVYFDGTCNLCNGFVDFLIRRDVRRRLHFAPLQGRTAREHLPDHLITNPGSVVFSDDRGLATETTAAIRTLAALGGPWVLANILWLVPRSWANFVYRVVARNRFRWFGRRESCRVPSADERGHLLD